MTEAAILALNRLERAGDNAQAWSLEDSLDFAYARIGEPGGAAWYRKIVAMIERSEARLSR